MQGFLTTPFPPEDYLLKTAKTPRRQERQGLSSVILHREGSISNALQWRLQYGRVIERANLEDGVIAVYRANP